MKAPGGGGADGCRQRSMTLYARSIPNEIHFRVYCRYKTCRSGNFRFKGRESENFMILILLILFIVFIGFFFGGDGIDPYMDEADQLDEMDFLIEEWDREDAGRNAFSDEFDDHWDDF